MASLLTWLDDRTGYKGFVRAALYEHVPGGARWRYVWGSTLVFAFAVQMITGLFLWMHYSPSATTAWESVYYIQHEMYGGWLLRGIHHYTAQVMIVLLALHMLQVIIDGAYRAPREVNFWIGLVLLVVVLFLSLTGYLLPWDQKGYWATKVATSLMAVVPGIGTHLQRLVVGGPEYGHHTLTRFFALHAGLLPFLMIVLTAAHVYVFRRHGLTVKQPRHKPDTYFWPDQVLRDAVACLGVLAVVLLLSIRFGFSPGVGFGDPGRLGAELAAPADPSEPYGAARPEWYFLFLFQFLKLPFFAGHNEIYGAVIIPGVVMGLLFLMPLTGRWKVGHWFNVLLTVFLAAGIVLLTAMALIEDAGRPSLRIPGLNRLDIRFSIVWLGLLVLGALVLLPIIGREKSARLTAYVLGALAFGVVIAVAVVAAGGGTDRGAAMQGSATRPSTLPAGAGVPIPTAPPQILPTEGTLTRAEQIHRYLLFGLLGGLVLLVTIALLTSPSRTAARLDAPREITSAADAAATRARDQAAAADVPDDVSWVKRWQRHHRLRLALLLIVAGGAVLLTAVSLVGGGQNDEKRVAYRAAAESARRDAERIVQLAGGGGGIPPQGAVWLLRNDPATQGPRLFARNCASCHRYDGHDGLGQPVRDPQSAPDLHRFAARDWIRGMLDPKQVDSARYFGPYMKAHDGKMVEYVKENLGEALLDEEPKDLDNIVIALAAEANLPSHREADARDVTAIEAGRKAMVEEPFECTECHAFREHKPSLGGANRGPDLTGYGSRQWLIDFIKNPEHPRFYPGDKNDRMPLYGEQRILDEKSIALIADWIRGDSDGPPALMGGEGGTGAAVSSTIPAAAPATTAPSTTAPAATLPSATAPAVSPSVTTPSPAPAPAPMPAKPKPEESKPPESKPATKGPDKPSFETEFETPE